MLFSYPSYTGAMKVGLAYAMMKQMEENMKKMADFTLPLLILHGAEDALCALSGSQDMMKLVSSKDKTIKVGTLSDMIKFVSTQD